MMPTAVPSVIACGILAFAAVRADAECVAAASVSGDPEAAAEVAAALARLGVDEAAPGERACTPVAATVRREGTGLALTVRAGARVGSRVVGDASIAATWIESWVRDDAAPLWTAPPPVAIRAPSMTRASPPRMRRPELALLVGHEVSAGGTAWDGFAASACYRVGPWCGGLAGRYVTNTSTMSDDPDDGSGGTTAARRTSVVAAAALDRRFQVGRVAIAPQLAIGIARTESRRHEPSAPCLSGDCAMTITYVGDGFTAHNTTARFGAGLTVAVPLASWLALDGRLGLEYAAGAHPAPHRHDATRHPIAASVGIAAGDPLLDLPGDPAWLVGAAVGLRVEVP